METATRTLLGALTISVGIAAAASPALAGACAAHGSRSIATAIDPTMACAPNEPAWTGMTPAKRPAHVALRPDTRTFALMLLAVTARMSAHKVEYTIDVDPPRAPHQGPLSASVSAAGGMEAILNAPSVLGTAFMMDLGLLVPDQSGGTVNPWTLADLGGVNTLTRPKASTWTAPNRNTMFSDLFGEPEAKPETRQP